MERNFWGKKICLGFFFEALPYFICFLRSGLNGKSPEKCAIPLGVCILLLNENKEEFINDFIPLSNQYLTNQDTK